MDEKNGRRNARTATDNPNPAVINSRGMALSNPPNTAGGAATLKSAPPHTAPNASTRVGVFTVVPHPPPAAGAATESPLCGTTRASILSL